MLPFWISPGTFLELSLLRKEFQVLLRDASVKGHKMNAPTVLKPHLAGLAASTSTQNVSQAGNAIPEKKLEMFWETCGCKNRNNVDLKIIASSFAAVVCDDIADVFRTVFPSAVR